MALSSPKIRIFGALSTAGVLVAGSIFISYFNISSLFTVQTANAASTQALLQAYATKDSDGDGLPDWEEELYGLDPNNSHSFSPNMTDGEAVARGLVKPKFSISDNASDATSTIEDTDDLDGVNASAGSLTDQFSQILLSQYLSESANSNGTPSDDDISSEAEGALQSFAQTNQNQDAYSISQVKVGGTGQIAMEKYAADAEKVFAENSLNLPSSEVDYFSDVVNKNDPIALKNLTQIAKSYTAMAPAFMEIVVPVETENAHLEIANAMYRLGADITDMTMLNTDPLRAYFGLAQYQTDAQSLAKGMSNMGNTYSTEQITIPENEPGYYFLQLILSERTGSVNTTN
jgi:hypothetical protein